MVVGECETSGDDGVTMEKYDTYKVHKADYVSPKDPVLLTIKPAKYLIVDGEGEPGGPRFQEATQALYTVAYTMKFMKKAESKDYKVAGLEGLWWTKSGRFDWQNIKPSEWLWKLLIRTPEFITRKDVNAAQKTALVKGKPAKVKDVKLETIKEGKSIQILHIGPYDAERSTVERMEAFAQEMGLAFHQYHHEIYLSDPRRVKPEKIRTILRHPVK
jgi:hypothetical protein